MASRDLSFRFLGEDVSAGKTMSKMGHDAEGLGDKLGKIGGLIAGAFAVDKVTDFFRSSIDEAREAQKVGAQTAAVLKSTSGAAGLSSKSIGDLATKLSNLSGVDDEVIQQGENVLLTFTNIRNEAGKGNDIFSQTTGLALDMSKALGQDMQSSVIQLGKALNDPVKGVTALQRVGVSFTQQQRDQIKTLVDSGRTLDAQKLILGEVRKEFGGTAAATATAGDKWHVAVKNLEESIGTKLLPVIDKLANFATSTLIPDLTKIAQWVKRNQEWLVPLVATLGTAVAVYKGVTLAVNTFKTAQLALNLAMTANPIGLIVAAIAALAVGFVVAWKKSETFRDVVKTAFGGIKTAIVDVKNTIGGIWDGLKSGLVSTINWVIDKLDKLISAYNKIPLLPDIPLIPKISTVDNTKTVTHGTATGGAHAFASGGIVKGGRGGVLGLIGEKSYDEAVIPLPPGAGIGQGNGVNVVINGPVYGTNSDELARQLTRALARMRSRNGAFATI